MELISLVLSVAAIAGLVVGASLWRTFMPAYVGEKAKNLASKEDLAHLTGVVEGIKATYTADLERLKSSLADDAQATERRRRVYEDISRSLRVFVDGHSASDEAKQAFHSAYATAWLWASDEVLCEFNQFIILQRCHAAGAGAITQEQLKAAYVAIVLAMRKNVGFSDTSIQHSSYQFVRF